MKALTVIPGEAGSACLDEVDEPPTADGPILVATHSIGVCGTDREILSGAYGTPPPGERRLILGHESVGRVIDAPLGSTLRVGDWVVGIVRRPDPVPCGCCAVGEWDMCENGRYTERGIRGLHGFGAQRYRIDEDRAVKLDPRLGELGVLIEPTSVVAKAWEHVDHIGGRSHFAPRRALVTGAGPIGLLAALLGMQRGLEVDVLDRAPDGPKPALTRAIGARYVAGGVAEAAREADIVVECTGAASVITEAIANVRRNAIVCLTGLSSGGATMRVDVGALNRDLVLENNVIFGSVNANRRHYEAASRALALAPPAWLGRLITRRVPLARWAEALAPATGDIKSVIVFDERTAS